MEAKGPAEPPEILQETRAPGLLALWNGEGVFVCLCVLLVELALGGPRRLDLPRRIWKSRCSSAQASSTRLRGRHRIGGPYRRVFGSRVRWRREDEVSATWKVKTAEKWRHRGRHRGLRLHQRNRWMVLEIQCGCASRVKEEVSVCTEQVGRTPRTTTQNQVVITLSMGTYIN
jgi:hypothetical protein